MGRDGRVSAYWSMRMTSALNWRDLAMREPPIPPPTTTTRCQSWLPLRPLLLEMLEGSRRQTPGSLETEVERGVVRPHWGERSPSISLSSTAALCAFPSQRKEGGGGRIRRGRTSWWKEE